MDANLILGGRGVDSVAALDAGLVARNNADLYQQKNRLAGLYQAQGPNLLAGDPGAVNMLAQIDPMAAQTLQQNAAQGAADLTYRQAQTAQIGADARQKIADAAAQMTKEQADKVAADARDDLMILSQTPADQWDAVVTARGLPEWKGRFNERGTLLAQNAEAYKAFIEASKGPKEQWVNLTPEEAAALGFVSGQRNTVTGKIEGNRPQSGMSLTTADGTTLSTGPGAGAQRLTEAQSKDAGFATRMEGAIATLDGTPPGPSIPGDKGIPGIADANASRWGQVTEAVPFGLARGLQSNDYQLASNAAAEFRTALLRKDSGAVISDSETRDMNSLYIPQPGDSDALLKRKQEARARALAGLKSGLPYAAIVTAERNGRAASVADAAAGAAGSGSPVLGAAPGAGPVDPIAAAAADAERY